MRILPVRSDRSRVALWIFVLAWFVGNFGLIAGFEGAEERLQQLFCLAVLGLACGAWWGAYKMSGFRARGGFVVIGLWMLSLIVPLLDFRHYSDNLFFWGAIAMLVLLAGAAMLTPAKTVSQPPG